MLIFFTALAFVMALAGGLLPMTLLSRRAMWRLFSLRAGLLLSVAFTEILPEGWRHGPALAGWGALLAFALLFVMEKLAMGDSCPEYLENCRQHTLGWTALLALSAHSFIDGFNLSVAYSAGTVAGAAIGVALALHKIADGFTLTSLFEQNGYDRRQSLTALVAVALTTPAGVVVRAAGLGGLGPAAQAGWLGFAAGSFIYLGAMDILPQIHKNEDKSCLAYFGLGLIGMAALRFV